MSIGTTEYMKDPLSVRASPGKLSEKYSDAIRKYQPSEFCSTADADCAWPGVHDPISHDCIPPSEDDGFTTKLVVREPQPAFKVITQETELYVVSLPRIHQLTCTSVLRNM